MMGAHQPEPGVVSAPAGLGWVGPLAPPTLVDQAKGPTRLRGRQADQPVAPFCFLAYAGVDRRNGCGQGVWPSSSYWAA
ncbi:MAG: hypothetical protein MI924_13810 [Chloroflexales bacterium]|nr:hypothetical protein [Chloroflexales bacterium]